MRLRCVKAILYWILGIFTSWILLSAYYERCKESNLILDDTKSDRIVEEGKLRLDSLSANSEDSNKDQSIFNRSNNEGVEKSHQHDDFHVHVDTTVAQSLKVVSTTPSTSMEFLNCHSIGDILRSVQRVDMSLHKKENKFGNRAVYFTSIVNPDGDTLRVAVKYATCFNKSSESETYRYSSALKEIYNLRKLHSLKWKGIPDLYGACITEQTITYVVTQIPGVQLCNGNGTDRSCALAKDLKHFVWETPDPEYTTMKWLVKTTCFFQQFERDHIFMEDFSGSNFYYSHDTLDIYIVDADSIVQYGDIRMFSRTSCRENRDCSRPSGNLWRQSALNYKIYYSCQEMEGYCFNNTCWGFDASLHNCGVARWLLGYLRRSVPSKMYQDYMDIFRCLMAWLPQDRCSMASACDRAVVLLNKFSEYREKHPVNKNSIGA